MLVRVSAPHFVAAVVVEDDKIVQCAPILAWSKGLPMRTLMEWTARHGYLVETMRVNRDLRH
jgi:hypothetical protein